MLGAYEPRPSRRPLAARQPLANWEITTTSPPARSVRSRPIRRRLASIADTCLRVEPRGKGSPPSARHCRFP
jgi:hypothetical protein